jgi:hypothetical protein
VAPFQLEVNVPQATGTISQAIMGNSSGEIPLGILGYGGTGRANTIYVWGIFHGATVWLQCRPDQINTDQSHEWFPVNKSDGTPISWTDPNIGKVQPHGAFSFIGRAGGYRLVYSSLASDSDIKYEVR